MCLFKAQQRRMSILFFCCYVVCSSCKWWRPTYTCVSLMPGAVRALSTYNPDVLQFFRILKPAASMTMFYPCFALFGPLLLLHPTTCSCAVASSCADQKFSADDNFYIMWELIYSWHPTSYFMPFCKQRNAELSTFLRSQTVAVCVCIWNGRI